jgi:hypothetical protein
MIQRLEFAAQACNKNKRYKCWMGGNDLSEIYLKDYCELEFIIFPFNQSP